MRKYILLLILIISVFTTGCTNVNYIDDENTIGLSYPEDSMTVRGRLETFYYELPEGNYRVFTITSIRGVSITAIKVED